jgi:hypothetical protein
MQLSSEILQIVVPASVTVILAIINLIRIVVRPQEQRKALTLPEKDRLAYLTRMGVVINDPDAVKDNEEYTKIIKDFFAMQERSEQRRFRFAYFFCILIFIGFFTNACINGKGIFALGDVNIDNSKHSNINNVNINEDTTKSNPKK